MWIVAQSKHKDSSILIDSLKEKLGSSPELYTPKILIEKITKNKILNKKKFILENYVFLKHEKLNKKLYQALSTQRVCNIFYLFLKTLRKKS